MIRNERGSISLKGKAFLFVLVGVGLFFGIPKLAEHGIIPTPGFMKALVPNPVHLPDVKDAQIQNVKPAPMPNEADASVDNTLVRAEIWEWNAQMNMIYANGGPTTTRNSLMEKYKVNLALIRQDDTNKMQEDLIACAKEIHDGAKQCSNGANLVVIMGDGAGQFVAAVNPQLKKLNDKLVVIAGLGYSRGEDACMLIPEAKLNPQAAKGSLIEAVLRDGDWNICMNWAGANGIKSNPDEKTWDPDAINWVNASDYNVAAADYVAGKCEDRKVVKDGRPTGETKHVCVNGVATWTPGDVTVAQKKGGLVKVASSKEYRSQMPAVILGSKNFFNANRDEIVGLLAASFDAGDQIKAFPSALHKAADISAKVYADQDGAYWEKYYKGVVEKDATGLQISLGGSAVNNLKDNMILFGLESGANDNFRSTYNMFASIAVQQYPDVFKDQPIPDVGEVEDRSYITAAQALMTDQGSAPEVPKYVEVEQAKTVVSKRDYHINFETGKSTLTSEGLSQLRALKDQFAINGLSIKVVGYTDNTGNEDKVNRPLSQARAQAVKTYLQQVAPKNFPESRFQVLGKGSQEPVDSNATAEGRAANRRVQISLVE
jgi:outer membrane protein OmpA-like peptidoglycan-associated protein